MNFSGSRWWKFDFHAHTPKSDDYGRGNESLKNITPEEWLLDYMKAEIDCVAVTDHNSGEWIDVLKNAYRSLEKNQPHGFRQLFIFPGVEIAVSGGVHVLAILDTDKSSSDVSTLLGLCGYTGEKGKIDTCTSKSIVDVIKEIESFGAIAIPAHVDKNGLFSQIKGNTLKDVINLRSELYCVELIDKDFILPELCNSEKARWSFVCGSDSHLSSEVGRRYTYVKMGKPCLEGLKLALMDGGDFSLIRSDDIKYDPNKHADFIIKSLEIKDARYCGNGSPLRIEFNPWLNCFIGGRGSGKSTIIEFLRIVMRLEKEIEIFGEDSELFKSFGKFFQVPKKRDDKGALREKTAVIAECILDGTTFLVQWANDGSLISIQEKQSDGTLKPSPGEISVRFPVRIYSQKQMFEIASNPEALLNIIDESPEVRCREWKTTNDRICAQYRSLKSKCRELEVQIKEENTLSGDLEDVKRKLRLFEQDENTHIRKEYQKKRSQEKEIEIFLESLQKNNDFLQKVEIETITPRSELFSDSQDALAVNNLFDEYIAKAKTINDELSRLKMKVQSLSEDFSAAIEASVWKKNLQLSLKTYTDLNEKLKAEGLADPNEYGRLIQQKQIIDSKIKNIENLKTAKENIEKQAYDESEKLLKHRKELTVKRRQFISAVSENNSFIRIEIEGCSARENLEKSFRSLLGREEGFQDDIENLLSDLSAEFDFEKLSALKEELRNLKSGQSGRAMADKRFLNYIQRSVTEEMLDAVDLWYPDDNLVISYKRETGKSDFISIEQGSPGQKTAAILAFLLSYGNEPMILDQPEDDLDNHLIFDLVVRQLRENKKRRQIIIVTHNPNIVVNGDAEMVHVLDFKDGQSRIIQKGCLQEKNVRAEICKIMEGGKTAFEQRFRRINI